MVLRSECRGEIAADVDDVYGYLSDVVRWPEWASAIVECRVAGAGPMEAGARLEQRVRRAFGSTGARHLDVVAAEPSRSLAFAGMMGPSPLRWGFDLSGAGDGGTVVLLWVEANLRGPMRLMPSSLLRRLIRRVNERELMSIGSALGSSPPVSEAMAGA
jgi:polyketide cyclase/dehydrase/lipid transport protein